MTIYVYIDTLNTPVHETTKHTTYELVFGQPQRSLVIPEDIDWKEDLTEGFFLHFAHDNTSTCTCICVHKALSALSHIFISTTGEAYDTMGSAQQNNGGDMGADNITQEYAHQLDSGDIGGQGLKANTRYMHVVCTTSTYMMYMNMHAIFACV